MHFMPVAQLQLSLETVMVGEVVGEKVVRVAGEVGGGSQV
jgi:hypothetical protein